MIWFYLIYQIIKFSQSIINKEKDEASMWIQIDKSNIIQYQSIAIKAWQKFYLMKGTIEFKKSPILFELILWNICFESSIPMKFATLIVWMQLY